jgi:predicted acylesterase/phospholipase RssA
MSTIYFSHCWGVFEGGGVRASAHAGAFAAARKAGVNFGRVAGTSGGSIVAALIAAGYDAPQLSKLLDDTDFPSFIIPSGEKERSFFRNSYLIRAARLFTCGRWKNVATIALNSGLHSSSKIESWMEKQLRDIIGGERGLGMAGPITFKELRLPLHVVATDLVSGQPKIWSRETTPDDSVAFAVRCSCTIPFFYRAVPFGSSLLIDGGAVSNLPSYIFSTTADGELDRGILSEILAFRLCEEGRESEKPSRLLDFLTSLANAVISSATYIQSSLQPDVYVISINTGKIRSTDFDIDANKKKILHASGENSVTNFLRKERSKIRTDISTRVYQGYDEKLLLMIKSLKQCEEKFYFIGVSTYWVDFSFLAISSAARRGVEITCIVSRTSDRNELRRRSLLSQLGATILSVDDEKTLPIDGFLFDLSSAHGRAVISDFRGKIGDDKDYTSGKLRVYTYANDSVVLDIVSSEVSKFILPKAIKKIDFPFLDCSPEELFDRLRKISFYKNAKISIRSIDVSKEILVLQKSVKEFKVFQMERHIEDLKSLGLDLFDLKKVLLNDGSHSIVCPPILEEMDGQLIVIDGNTRLLHCLVNNVKKITVIVISGVTAPLPASNPRSLSMLNVASATRTLRSNYKDMNESLFRRIDEVVHHLPWYLANP